MQLTGRQVLFIFIGIVAVGFYLTNAPDRDDERSEPREAAEPEEVKNVTGTFLRWEPVDDARGYAHFSVTNNGDKAVTVTCTISVRNDFGDFGFDSLVGERIAAFDTLSGKIPINVGEGSFLIEEGEVKDC